MPSMVELTRTLAGIHECLGKVIKELHSYWCDPEPGQEVIADELPSAPKPQKKLPEPLASLLADELKLKEQRDSAWQLLQEARLSMLGRGKDIKGLCAKIATWVVDCAEDDKKFGPAAGKPETPQ